MRFYLLLALCLVTSARGLTPVGFAATAAFSDDTETESGDGSKAADKPVGASEEGRQAMGSFKKPEGWEVSLFAAEPELANPVAMYVDNDGRVFVCESFRQDRGVTDNRGHDQEWLMADLSAQSVQDRIDYFKRLLGADVADYGAHDDRIRLLVDTDGDNVADRATMFAEGFNQIEDGTGAGVLFRGDDVYFTCIPKLWKLTDADRDGVAEERVALHDGYGVRVAFRGHDSHGLVIGPDGRLYFSIGDRGYNITTSTGQLKNVESGAVFRCELDGSNLEVFANGLRNPQELAFDDYGYLFTGENNSDSGDKARWVNVMEGGDTGWRMMYQYLPDRGPFNREHIWEPYSEKTPAYIVPPIANIGDGPAGLTCYPGTGLIGDYANCFFMVDFRGGSANSGIRLIRTQPKGAFWEVERSEQPIWNILATDVQFGPDGALWVCDWVNGWVGEGKGRIYRFFEKSAAESDIVAEVKTLLGEGFADRSDAELGSLLRHLDRRVRLESQWELSIRGNVDPFVELLGDSSAGTVPRLHAVWGLGHAARVHSELRDSVAAALVEALADTDLDVRATAASVVGDLRLERFSEQIIALLSDVEPRVKYAACLAANKLGLEQAVAPAVELLRANDNADPGLRHAGIMALAGAGDLSQVVALKTHDSSAVRLAAVVALRKQEDARIVEFLGDTDPAVVLEAARAVNDVPELHAGLPQLARLIDSELEDEALIRRVLNANFRLGGDDAIGLLADYAADAAKPDAMRIEAIEMLGTWSEPGKLDRVMNRFMPLEAREPELAVQAIESRLTELLVGSPKVVAATISSATKLGIEEAGERLRAIVADGGQPVELRTDALAGLAFIDAEATAPLLKEMLVSDAPELRAAAIRLLAPIDAETALTAVKRGIQDPVVIVQQAAWDAVAELKGAEAKALISKGVNQYVNGVLPPDTWLNVIEAATGNGGKKVKEKLAAFQQQMSAKDSLEAHRAAMFGGDPKAGEELFFTKTELSCVRCHKVADIGGEVGPVLTEIGKAKDNRYLLEAIVAPDAKIAENYETVILLTEDAQVLTGILRKETPSIIELVDANGEVITVDPLDVISRKKGKSAMPVDLLKSMSDRELRDLVAYLSSLKGE